MTASSQTPKPKIPATIITGFLGAGKTTLLKMLMVTVFLLEQLWSLVSVSV